MKIACRFFWHNWGVWGMPQAGYMRMVQHRFCKDCGRQQDRSFYAEQAMPVSGDTPKNICGLTKRERFAMTAMHGILSNGVDFTMHEDKDVAAAAVIHADNLLAELGRSK